MKAKAIFMGLGCLIFLIGLVWIIAAHIYLLFYNDEYAKHIDTFWAELQLIRVAWEGCCLVLGGGALFLYGDTLRHDKSRGDDDEGE